MKLNKELIRELAKQAGITPGVMGLNRFTHFDPEKFGEMIVQECLQQVDKIRDGLEADNEREQALGADWSALAISRHFGLE